MSKTTRGREWALRADGVYRFGGSWLDSLHFGARYADRDQTVRYSAYNWGNIVNDWNLGSNQYLYWNIDQHAAVPSIGFSGYPNGLYDARNFGSSFFGGSGDFVFFDMDKLENHGADLLSFSNLGIGQDQWEPICSNGGTAQTGPRTGEIDGTCFRPDEINKLSETTKAGYVMLKFGGREALLGSTHVSGNVGVRFIDTVDQVTGSTVFPLIDPATNTCQRAAGGPGGPPALPYTIGCYLFGNAALIAGDPQPGRLPAHRKPGRDELLQWRGCAGIGAGKAHQLPRRASTCDGTSARAGWCASRRRGRCRGRTSDCSRTTRQ